MSEKSHKKHCSMHVCKKCKECGQRAEIGQMKDSFTEQKRSYRSGQDRAKGQPLNDKITRGDFFGKKWFPFGGGKS